MLNAVTLAAVSALALAAPRAVPAVPAVPAAPATHATSVSWGDDTAQEIPASLDWQVRPTQSEAAPPGAVDFELGYHTEHHSSNWGRTLTLAELGGLTEAQLQGEGQPVAFTLRRDAGDFRCKGVAGLGKGVGNCVYAANPAFPGELSRRGVTGGLAPYQQFQLSMSDIGVAYLDELRREAYATPSTDDLVRAGNHGAGLKQLLAMNAAGYRFGDVATFVHARDHGVSAKYIEALKGYGYAHLTAADLVRMRDHGVSATYIGELRDRGYANLPAEALVHLRDHGVSAAYVGELRNAGYARLSAEDLARLRDHGVSAGFVAELHAMGYDGLTPDQLMRLRDHGISAGFIRVSNQGGPRLSPDELIRLRERGPRD